LSQHYAVKVCRIEPENNVHLVLTAFQNTPNRNIVIVGNWENSDYGKRLKKAYKNLPNITLLEPIYEQREIDMIRGNANLYIHGHSNGGTNMSLIEAMYLGLPVFSFDDSF
jgi:glycosyltransferase involved in cell wall biosynthesis